jgi:prepilin-type N-terminal cleavage/methylation domain-containing protein
MMMGKICNMGHCLFSKFRNFLPDRKRNTGVYRSESGFTLIELLVVIPILSVILGVISMTIIMMMKVGTQNNDHALALSQVQNTGYWITRDVMNGQIISPQPEPGIFLRIEWDDWDGTPNEIEYVFSDNELRRQVNGSSPGTLVAKHIVIEDTTFAADPVIENQYRLTVKAAQGEAEVERIYRALVRVPDDEG